MWIDIFGVVDTDPDQVGSENFAIKGPRSETFPK